MNSKKITCFHCCLGLLCAALLGACSSTPALPGGDKKAGKLHFAQLRRERERTYQSMWNGKSYASLIEAMGPPSVVMEIPGRGTLTASIYGMDESTQCVDTFTVANLGNQMMVDDYFCR